MHILRLIGLLLLGSWQAAALAQATVERFDPAGSTGPVKLVKVRFSAPMIALGSLDHPAPLVAGCPEPGAGRWVDQQNWLYEFAQPLARAKQCSFTLRADLKDAQGMAVAGGPFRFDTGGPFVKATYPSSGQPVFKQQTFAVLFDAPVDAASFARHATCHVPATATAMPVKLLGQADTAAFLKVNREYMGSWYGWNAADAPVVVLTCAQALPPSAQVELVLGRGLAAPNGLQTTEDQIQKFSVQGPFEIITPCPPLAPRRGSARQEWLDASAAQKDFTLTFSAPVPRVLAEKIILTTDKGQRLHSRTPPENARATFLHAVHFPGLDASDAKVQVVLPPGLRDDLGRTLHNAEVFRQPIRSCRRAPSRIALPAHFGVLEAAGPRQLKVAVHAAQDDEAGLKEITGRSHQFALTGAHPEEEIAFALSQKRPEWYGSVQDRPSRLAGNFKLPVPARGMQLLPYTLPGPGLYRIDLERGMEAASTLVLVTNLALHARLGLDGSVVWVTRLDTGAPLANASITVHRCGKQVWSGHSGANGLATPLLVREKSDCHAPYLLIARSGADLAFLQMSHPEYWTLNSKPVADALAGSVVHSVLDRTLFRKGETVHMKHFARLLSTRGIEVTPLANLHHVPDLEIRHALGGKWQLALDWDAAASAHSAWTVPPEAALGSYEVWIGGRQSASFQVAEMRIPTTRASIVLPEQPDADGGVKALFQATHMSGGGVGSGAAWYTVHIDPHHAPWEADAHRFTTVSAEATQWTQKGASASDTRHRLTLDGEGRASAAIHLAPGTRPASLAVRFFYTDPNGEVREERTSMALPGTTPRQLGMAASPFSGAPLTVRTTAAGGAAAAGVAVAVAATHQLEFKDHERLLGGSVVVRTSVETRDLGTICSGRTNAQGLLKCAMPALERGTLQLRAHSLDAAGATDLTVHVQTAMYPPYRPAASAPGRDAGGAIALDKPAYRIGDSAALTLPGIWPPSTVHLTVHREGVMHSVVQDIAGKDPVLRLPVQRAWAPHVALVANVTRGRLAGRGADPDDSARPAARRLEARLQVGPEDFRLGVEVATDKRLYKVREPVRATVRVRLPDGSPAARNTEVILAVVDAGLLRLSGNTSGDLLNWIMQAPRDYGRVNFGASIDDLLSRHPVFKPAPFHENYPLAAPSAASAMQIGAQMAPARERFDSLVLWSARVQVDARGVANVTFPMNDSLTEFEVLAVASSGADMFGSARTSLRVSQDVQVLPGLPLAVRQGDRFQASFTVRNTSARAVSLRVAPGLRSDSGPVRLAPRPLKLAAGASRTLSWQVAVPADATVLHWDVLASAPDGGAGDRVQLSQTVAPATPVLTTQASLVQIEGQASMPVRLPDTALAGRGGVVATLSASVAGSLDGVRSAMLAYPYRCVEQRLSRAVALDDPALKADAIDYIGKAQRADGLLDYFSGTGKASIVLTAYVLALSAEADVALEPGVRARMAAALRRFVRGAPVADAGSAAADATVLRLAALDALGRNGPLEPADLAHINPQPQAWPTSALIDWHQVLQRMPEWPERGALLKNAELQLRARLDLNRSRFRFLDERGDQHSWMMVNGDVNAARLLLAMADNAAWKNEMGMMAHGLVARMQQGRWSTTVANAWSTLALAGYRRRFEADPVTGSTTIALGQQQVRAEWGGKAAPAAAALNWPPGQASLQLRHSGTGKPWALVQTRAAIPLRQPVALGYRLAKTISGAASQVGGIVQVDLDIDASEAMDWVVVDDPLPPGATMLGQDGPSPHIQEVSATAVRTYFRHMGAGKHSIRYTYRLNNAGQFLLPATHVEAMYQPELRGDLPNAPLNVTADHAAGQAAKQ